MNLRTTLRRLFTRRPPPIRVVNRPSRSLRLSEWQASETLVAEGRQLLANPLTQTALDVLRNESPLNYGLPELGVPATDLIRRFALIEGYQLCLNNFEALGMLQVVDRPVEATFEPAGDLPPDQ